MLAITATTSSLNTGNRKSSGQRAQFPMKSEIAYRKALASDMDRVGELIREYAGSIGVDIEYQGLSEELAGLPGKYAEPKGAILVAQRSSCLVGMVALRDLGDGACEMKRLYVATSARGLGIGRALVDLIVREGAEKGYRVMRLDTLRSMESALGLYRAAGFQERDPYIYNPLPGAVYMEKTLRTKAPFSPRISSRSPRPD